jgi:hypothetical protein
VNELTLFCNVTGNPYPKVRWLLKNGEPVKDELVGSSCGRQKKGYYYKNEERTKLLICDVDLTDIGFYTCAIQNKLRNDSKKVYVNVIGKFNTCMIVHFSNTVQPRFTASGFALINYHLVEIPSSYANC